MVSAYERSHLHCVGSDGLLEYGTGEQREQLGIVAGAAAEVFAGAHAQTEGFADESDFAAYVIDRATNTFVKITKHEDPNHHTNGIYGIVAVSPRSMRVGGPAFDPSLNLVTDLNGQLYEEAGSYGDLLTESDRHLRFRTPTALMGLAVSVRFGSAIAESEFVRAEETLQRQQLGWIAGGFSWARSSSVRLLGKLSQS